MLPPAPGLFSTTTDPSFGASPCATRRAMMSVVPPGPNGTMRWMGLEGYCCAIAGAAPAIVGTAPRPDQQPGFALLESDDHSCAEIMHRMGMYRRCLGAHPRSPVSTPFRGTRHRHREATPEERRGDLVAHAFGVCFCGSRVRRFMIEPCAIRPRPSRPTRRRCSLALRAVPPPPAKAGSSATRAPALMLFNRPSTRRQHRAWNHR